MTTPHNTEVIRVKAIGSVPLDLHLQLAGTFIVRLFYVGEVAQNSKIDATKKKLVIKRK